MTITDRLIAGDTLDFEDDFPQFPPSDGWTLKYRLVARFTTPVTTPIDLTATTFGEGYRVQAGIVTTAAWADGAYSWARWVERLGERVSLGEGSIEIIPDPATRPAGYDARSHARKVLDQIEEAIEGLRYGVKSYAIGGRIWTKEDLSELIKLQQWYKQLVTDETAVESGDGGGANNRMMKVRLSRG